MDKNDWLDSRLQKLEDRQDKIFDAQAKLAINMAIIAKSLEEHMKDEIELARQVEPLKKKMSVIDAAWKIIASSGIIAGFLKTFNLF